MAPPEGVADDEAPQGPAGPAGWSRATVVAVAIGVAVVTGIAAWLVPGLIAGPAYRHPATRAVRSLLRVRSDLSTDPADYAPYVLESAVATALAEDSAGKRGGGKAAIPSWKPPYVSMETSAGAVDVVVEWRRSSELTSWPAANVFKLVLSGDDWKMTDAQTVDEFSIPEPMRRR